MSVDDAVMAIQESCNSYKQSGERCYKISHSFPFDVALCTVEKGNQLINVLSSVGLLHEVLCIIVVDEVHLVADAQRGELLNVMLSKITFQNHLEKTLHQNTNGTSQQSFMSQNPKDFASGSHFSPPFIQIVAMSATLSNLKSIARWLNAEQYETSYRPIDLKEMIYCENWLMIYEPKLQNNLENDSPSITKRNGKENWITIEPSWDKEIQNQHTSESLPSYNHLSIKSISQGSSTSTSTKKQKQHDPVVSIVLNSLSLRMNTLLFCSTKKGTESTAKTIAHACQNMSVDNSIGKE